MYEFSLYNELNFVEIPTGSFFMGSSYDVLAEMHRQIWQAPSDWEFVICNEWPQHKVSLSVPFYMSETPVTQLQYAHIMGNEHPEENKSHPILLIWEQTIEMLEKLNQSNMPYEFRLPTEAEWEYSCKSGMAFEFTDHNDPDLIMCNEDDAKGKTALMNSGCDDEELETIMHEVKKFPTNNFRLYDMLGNAPEWCSDYYDSDYYYKSPHSNPLGPEKQLFDDNEKLRIVRGAPACQEFHSEEFGKMVFRASSRLYLSEEEKDNIASVRLVATSKI